LRNAISLFAILLVMSAILAQAEQKRVQVGTFTLGGTSSFGTLFLWTLDASKVTNQPICFGAVTFTVDGVTHSFVADALNPICTLPLIAAPSPNSFVVIGCDANTPDQTGCPLPSCFNGCRNITVQLISKTGKSFSFTLLNGKRFRTHGVDTSSMSPSPGQLYLTPGQSAPLYLDRVRRGSEE
jgi:hypothetical protein